MAMAYMLRKLFRLVLFLVIGSLLLACSSGDGDTETRAWVRIDSPVDGYATGASSVLVEGNSAMRDGSYPPDVFWQNNYNSGVASSSVICILGCISAWQANVPLGFGENVITVTMADGSDQVTVTRYSQVVVTGRMTMDTAAGASVPDIPLVLASADTQKETVTDLSGYYTFYNVLAGTYTITPTQPPLPQSSACMSFSPTSREVTVPANNNIDISGQDFIATQVTPCYYIQGRVTSSTDPTYGIQGVTVTLTDQAGNSMVRDTNVSGYFNFYQFEPGTYTLTPSYCTYYSCSTFTPSSIDVTIVDTNAVSQDFVRN